MTEKCASVDVLHCDAIVGPAAALEKFIAHQVDDCWIDFNALDEGRSLMRYRMDFTIPCAEAPMIKTSGRW